MFTGFAEAALPKEGRDEAAKPNKNVFISRKRHNQKCFPVLKLEPKWATDFLFSFISLLSISFVTDLICLYFLLASRNYLSVLLSIFMSFLSCRFCFNFCVDPFLFLTSCFSSFVLLFFSPPFIFFFLTVFLHLVFHFFRCVFYYSSRFSCFPFVYLLVLYPFHLFLKNMCVYACFVFCLFPSVSISFNKISRFFCLILIVFNIFKNKFLFLCTFNLIFGTPCQQKHLPVQISILIVLILFLMLLVSFSIC